MIEDDQATAGALAGLRVLDLTDAIYLKQTEGRNISFNSLDSATSTAIRSSVLLRVLPRREP